MDGHGIITDSKARADEFAQNLPRSVKSIYTIPNGVKLQAPKVSRADVHKYFDIPEDTDCVIGKVSGFAPFKGHRVLLEAAKRVLAIRPKACFLFVGFSREADGHVDALNQHARNSTSLTGCEWRHTLNISDVWNIIDIHVPASTFSPECDY